MDSDTPDAVFGSDVPAVKSPADPPARPAADLECALLGHTDSVRCVAFLADDDRLLASGSNDCTARIWDLETKTCKFILEGHRQEITDIAFSCDGKLLATASNDTDVRLWNTETSELVGILQGHDQDNRDKTKGHNEAVTCVAFKMGETLMMTGSLDGAVKVWDINTQTVRCTFEPQPRDRITGVAFDDEFEDKVYVSSSAGPVSMWDMETGGPWPDHDDDDDVISPCFVFRGRTWCRDVEAYVGRLQERNHGLMAWAVSGNQEKVAVAYEDRSVDISMYRDPPERRPLNPLSAGDPALALPGDSAYKIAA